LLKFEFENSGSVAECELMQDGEPRNAAAKTEAGRGVGETPRDDELAACKAELAASANAHAALQRTLATYCAEIEEVACSLTHVRRG
jgi:hypothetical protein